MSDENGWKPEIDKLNMEEAKALAIQKKMIEDSATIVSPLYQFYLHAINGLLAGGEKEANVIDKAFRIANKANELYKKNPS